jgi:hypothetical protein
MKLAVTVAAVALALIAGCDKGSNTARETGTQSSPVTTNAGEKPTVEPGSTASARAERGSGTEGTNSAGATTGSGTGSVGSTSR